MSPRLVWLVIGTMLLVGCPGPDPDDDTSGDDDTADDDTADDDDNADDDSAADDDDDTQPVDNDGDGFPEGEDCNDNNPAVYPGAEHTCDSVLDNDCDGIIDTEETDNDGDGYTECDGDCDDNEAAAYPGAMEVIDGVDNDCDGELDEDDCGNLPTDVTYNVMTDYYSYEDFAFDDQGYMYGFHQGNLFKTDYAGVGTLWSPGGNMTTAGTRALSTGDIVYSEVSTSSLVMVDYATAVRSTVLSGLSYGNGIEVDDQDFVYVAEQNSGQIRRVDPYTGDNTVLVTGLNNPNGIVFSPGYDILYVGSFGGGIIYALEVDPQGNPGTLSNLRTNIGTGALDGMGVDACGNVYVCDYGSRKVLRIAPDGLTAEVVVDLSSDTSWIPNMQWGSGVGGWDENTLYVIDIQQDIYEIWVGVESKARPYP